jgi:hypothetical protein
LRTKRRRAQQRNQHNPFPHVPHNTAISDWNEPLLRASDFAGATFR